MPSCPFVPGKHFDGGCRFRGRRHGDRDGAGADQGGGRAPRLDRRTRRSRNPIWSRRGASGAAPPGSSSGRLRPRRSRRWCGSAPKPGCRSCRRAAIPASSAAASRPRTGSNIVLALGRMNRIRAIDPVNFTMTVEAGCILAHLQRGGRRGRPAVPAQPRRRGQLPDRRQSVDQCRRHRGIALRQYARADVGRRGRAARTAGSGTGCAACARTIPATI